MPNENDTPLEVKLISPSLHDQIMRLPCTPPKDANVNQMLSYKSGHRDARHAAAELAAAHEAEQAAPVAVQDKNGLLPCPFCGGPAQQVFQLVGCLKCETAVKSVEHWNRRAIGGTEITRLRNEPHEAEQAIDCKEWDGWWLLDETPLRPGDTAAPGAAKQQPDGWVVISPDGSMGDVYTDKQSALDIATDCDRELSTLHTGPAHRIAPVYIGDTAAPERASLDCDYHGSHFGAVYPDAQCIDGYLWDEDSCDEPGGPLSVGGDIPCPKCNAAEYAEYLREDGDGEAPEQAEQPVKWGSAGTVGNLIAQLRTIDPGMPVYASLRVKNGVRDGVMLKGLIISYEHGDGRFIVKDGPEKCVVIWTQPDDRQAEQPHPVNRSVIRDVFLRNGFTIKEGHDDLKPYVYAAAEELLALDGKEVAAEQDAVKVPRDLLCRITRNGGVDTLLAIDELRALLGGDA